MRYQIIVGNVGTVLDTNNQEEAHKTYNEYCEISKSGVGRAGREQVSLFEDGEPIQEYSCPADPSWKEVLEKTDWALLREQKAYLFGMLRKFHKKEETLSQKEREAIDGIVGFLDTVQDAATEEIGKEKVFGNFEEEKES